MQSVSGLGGDTTGTASDNGERKAFGWYIQPGGGLSRLRMRTVGNQSISAVAARCELEQRQDASLPDGLNGKPRVKYNQDKSRIEMLTDKRVLALIERMGYKEQRQFACDCAENVLHYFENMLPDDHRPRKAIDTARRFALDQVTVSELHMAKADAEVAAWNTTALDDQSFPTFEAASSAAATAEMAASFPESAHKAAIATVSTAIETVMVAAVGSEYADHIWSRENGWESVGEDVALKARQVVEDQWEWQIRRGATYLK